MKKPATVTAIILLALVAAAHLARLILRIEVVAAGERLPTSASVVAVLVFGIVALLLWREWSRA